MAKSRDAKRAEIKALGPPPGAPLTPLLTCTEPSFEGLGLLLQAGYPSIGVFSADEGQFLGGYDDRDPSRQGWLVREAGTAGVNDPMRCEVWRLASGVAR
jgi:hypothetical protein